MILICPVTPAKIKEKLADVRAKLVVVISNWENSGNGSGQRSIDDKDFGMYCDMTLIDDNRSNFLGTNKSHLLYFWQLMDEYSLLQQTMSIIPGDHSATYDSVPSTARSSVLSGANSKRSSRESPVIV
jgi:hypothetical protein